MSSLASRNAPRAFDAVAPLCFASAAATELAVTPSAGSCRIGNLKEEFGVEFLTRDGRSIRPTGGDRRLDWGSQTPQGEHHRMDVAGSRSRPLREMGESFGQGGPWNW